MEICYLVKGRQTYRVGEQEFRLKGGDLFVTFPDEEHDTAGQPQEKGVLYWLILTMPEPGGAFLDLPPRRAAALAQALLGLKRRLFRGDSEIESILDEVTLLYHQKPSDLRQTRIFNQVVAFLFRVLDGAKRSPVKVPLDRFEAVQHFIRQRVTENLTVPSLAAEAGLSVSRFKAWFKGEAGVPPLEYMLRAKVEEARVRLEQGASVTTVAFALGFSTSQYFATVFKRYTGQQPRAVRRKKV
jgi:AraC-like DNA-binding protein